MLQLKIIWITNQKLSFFISFLKSETMCLRHFPVAEPSSSLCSYAMWCFKVLFSLQCQMHLNFIWHTVNIYFVLLEIKDLHARFLSCFETIFVLVIGCIYPVLLLLFLLNGLLLFFSGLCPLKTWLQKLDS